MPTAISLFSGLGGDTYGLTQAGVNVIAYNEINKTFCASHDANFKTCTLLSHEGSSDITKLPDSLFAFYQGKVDILFAGFPCQGFSSAGKKRDDDPRNTMFMEFVRATKQIQPYMIIGENVKGILTKKTPTGENYIDIIQSEFHKLGYTIQYKIMKCDLYGVPQKRERCIILGVRENPYQWVPKFPEPKKTTFTPFVHFDMTGAVKVSDALFKDIPATCILTEMKNTSKGGKGHPYLHSKIDADVDRRTYNNVTHSNLFSFGKRDSPIHCEIVDVTKPFKTIICTYDHQPRLFVPLKNSEGCFLRTLLPDELKQVQGFPKDYILCGTTKEQYVQIGNAVPPPLITAIVKNIL